MKNKNFLLVENNIKLLMRIFSLLGLVIMVYLTYIHYANASSFCDISENVSCDVVTTSLYSEVFGVPMSLLGVFYFGFVFLCSFFCAKKNLYQTVFLLTVLVLFPSLYLTAMEFFVIDSICILCESSKVLMLGILVVSYLGLRAYVRVTLQLIVPVFIAGEMVGPTRHEPTEEEVQIKKEREKQLRDFIVEDMKKERAAQQSASH